MSELTETRGEWQAVHVFYAANPQPLLVRCVRPLIASLTEDGLLAATSSSTTGWRARTCGCACGP